MTHIVRCSRCSLPIGSSGRGGFSLGDVIALDEGQETAAGRPRIARLYHAECWEEESSVGREGFEAAD
jgi:hypothetical protein